MDVFTALIGARMQTSYPNQFNLHGKVAVVTGGSGALGSEMSRGLAQSGASVAVLARTEEKVARTATEIEDRGGTAMGVTADVLQKSELVVARDEVLERFGKVDILVNAAGGNVDAATLRIGLGDGPPPVPSTQPIQIHLRRLAVADDLREEPRTRSTERIDADILDHPFAKISLKGRYI